MEENILILKSRCRSFLNRFIYTKLVWDGKEAMIYGETNDPHKVKDFMTGTPIDHHFREIIEGCEGHSPFEVSV